MFEDRPNAIINGIEKLINITPSINIIILTSIINSLLKRRTLKFHIPSEVIIMEYLKNSRFVSYDGEQIILNTEKAGLLKIEEDILECFKKQNLKYITYIQLKQHLTSLGYTNAVINKSVYNSPLMYVDKSEGKKKFKFIIASHFSRDILTTVLDDYQFYKERLKKLYGNTDQTSLERHRREQNILKEWLFKGKTHEKCAICGNVFSTSSLVTAHKKKRAKCSENERTDPYVVMPLCLFGCDHLYEREKISVRNGVVAVFLDNNMSEAEKKYLLSIQKRNIDEKWLAGNYFI